MSAAPDAPATPSPVPSYHDDVDVTKYDEMLAEKVEALRAKFAPLLRIPADDQTTDDETTELLVDVFPSPPKHFRSRCRFQVLAEKAVDAVRGAPDDGAHRPALSYHLREDGTTTGAIAEFPMALESINRAMPRLLDAVADDASGELADGLEAVHFLAARGAGGMHVTLVYSRPIDADGKWRAAASRARERLLREIAPPAQIPRTASADDPSGDAEGDTAFNLLGRSKGVSVLIGDANHVVERLRLRDGRVLAYHQPEGAFSNPNAFVAEHTVNWLRDVSAATAAPATRALRAKRRQSLFSQASGGEAHPTDRSPPTDPPLPSLLELYCGNGNHTVALASSFASVAAVELSAALCDAARANLARNGVSNARVFRAPSEAVARRALRRRRARGAAEATGKNNDTFSLKKNDDADDPGDVTVASLDVDAFDCVLVDPPRAGLDPDTLALVKKFDVVLYISCDPNSLFANATARGGLAETHALRRFAVFDHFPYTRHVEVGAVWVRKT
jgi:tRNA (uracil-5-)-methyltransferase